MLNVKNAKEDTTPLHRINMKKLEKQKFKKKKMSVKKRGTNERTL